MDSEAVREMTLIEWCAELPDSHLVNTELKTLKAEVKELTNSLVKSTSTSQSLLDSYKKKEADLSLAVDEGTAISELMLDLYSRAIKGTMETREIAFIGTRLDNLLKKLKPKDKEVGDGK